ncbi:type II secretion system F family protein [Acerihabitans sp. KWT182]|uniref:Type II secretion system F family protein n=1 Tax=Acerihabitans sp. KWT182 TaxID=3157919 RepID=A0AAU7QC00_9GAMM
MKGYWLYRWRAVTAEGEMIEGHRLAYGKRAVLEELIKEDLQPLKLRAVAYLSSGYWRDGRLMDLTSQLASLLEAGLPLRESLRLLGDDHPRAGWRCLLRLLSAKIEQGHSLSLACAGFPGVFSPLYCGLLELGELTGRLDRCCRLLAEHESRQGKLKKGSRRIALSGVYLPDSGGGADIYADMDIAGIRASLCRRRCPAARRHPRTHGAVGGGRGITALRRWYSRCCCMLAAGGPVITAPAGENGCKRRCCIYRGWAGSCAIIICISYSRRWPLPMARALPWTRVWKWPYAHCPIPASVRRPDCCSGTSGKVSLCIRD